MDRQTNIEFNRQIDRQKDMKTAWKKKRKKGKEERKEREKEILQGNQNVFCQYKIKNEMLFSSC